MKRAPDVSSTPEVRGTGARLLMGAIAWGGGALFAGSLGYFLYVYLWRFGRPVADGPAIQPILTDVLLFSAFALHHSVFARTGAKAWVRGVLPPPLERSTYTWIASLIFVTVCWQWLDVPGVVYRLTGPLRLVAYGVQASGLIVTILGARSLDVLDLAGIRQALPPLEGTPDRPAELSTTGVFGIVRHPLYFGWALLVCGAPDMTATRAVFAVVSTCYVAVAIPWEERGLLTTFGAEYEGYRERVRWRMLPFLY